MMMMMWTREAVSWVQGIERGEKVWRAPGQQQNDMESVLRAVASHECSMRELVLRRGCQGSRMDEREANGVEEAVGGDRQKRRWWEVRWECGFPMQMLMMVVIVAVMMAVTVALMVVMMAVMVAVMMAVMVSVMTKEDSLRVSFVVLMALRVQVVEREVLGEQRYDERQWGARVERACSGRTRRFSVLPPLVYRMRTLLLREPCLLEHCYALIHLG